MAYDTIGVLEVIKHLTEHVISSAGFQLSGMRGLKPDVTLTCALSNAKLEVKKIGESTVE